MYPDFGKIYLDKYVKELVQLSGLDEYTVERVVNTQIAIVLGNLAVKGESEHYMGTFSFEEAEGEIKFSPNSLVKDLCNGKLDPRFVIREIIDNA